MIVSSTSSILLTQGYACNLKLIIVTLPFFLQADRIVLIVDLWHPYLSLKEREALDQIFEPL
jgi:hypothetical protein